jgi:hypothetical protein
MCSKNRFKISFEYACICVKTIRFDAGKTEIWVIKAHVATILLVSIFQRQLLQTMVDESTNKHLLYWPRPKKSKYIFFLIGLEVGSRNLSTWWPKFESQELHMWMGLDL